MALVIPYCFLECLRNDLIKNCRESLRERVTNKDKVHDVRAEVPYLSQVASKREREKAIGHLTYPEGMTYPEDQVKKNGSIYVKVTPICWNPFLS